MVDLFPDAPDDLIDIAQRSGLTHPIEGLLCAPDRYEDCRVVYDDLSALPSSSADEPVVLQVELMPKPNGEILARGFDKYKNELDNPWVWQCRRLEIPVFDDYDNRAYLSVFGAVRQWQHVPPNEYIYLRATAKRFGPKLYLNGEMLDVQKVGQVAPVYLGSSHNVNAGETSKLIDWIYDDEDRLLKACYVASEVIRRDCGSMTDEEIIGLCMPKNLDENALVPLNLIELLSHLHEPKTPEQASLAKQIVDNICILSLQCRAYEQNLRVPCANSPVADKESLLGLTSNLIEKLNENLGKKSRSLTENQKQIAFGISERLSDERPLNGLLSGEVGTGKTYAYGIPAVAAHLSGAKVAIIAPTILLANQIASGLSEAFGEGIEIERVLAQGKIRNPHAILVGTKGLVSVAKRHDYKPDFLICDEQHKMDVESRGSMVAEHTHTLDVSATPIPRSLALSLYEGVDLYTLNEVPVEKNIISALIDTKERGIATAQIKRALENNERVAVVYTLVDQKQGAPAASLDFESATKRSSKKERDSEERNRARAVEKAKVFEQAFPGKVALLHGQLKDAEKIEQLDNFRSGKTPLMVTTTIFETGIDVPDVNVMIIRDAENLGVSQLHQLRGRLARAGGTAHCFLMVEDTKKLSDESFERLLSFTKTNDGYTLALEDMLRSGAGNLQGLQQRGKASTTFKGVKISSKDLLLGDRPDLMVDIKDNEPQMLEIKQTSSRQTQLFA